MRATASALVLALPLLWRADALGAALPDPARDSLKGLVAVNVVVDVQCARDEGRFESIVDEASLQTKLELELRRAGVKVVEAEEAIQAIFTETPIGTLKLAILAVPQVGRDEAGEPLAYAVAVELKMDQPLWKGGKATGRLIYGDTWSQLVVMSQGSESLRRGSVKQAAGELGEQFANDWLAVHGSKP